ncbi:helix-turn-helix domain-containing protein [Natronorubrum aibiense]|uniref:Bacterio-opsin activator n=1 Tax=Natronorubrum aibiense TaxID=348826 RepID=A0A5P9P0C1_9EURY|nr:helix-turn-helix domain-containing protein [Natronorubrum aibiense]QFU81476.1 bacterio-opsin activator [Natronorubrum aibiense]
MHSADLTLRLPQSMQLPTPDADAVYREELLSWDIDTGSETLRFLSRFVGDPEAARDAAADLEIVHRYELTPVGEGTYYGYAVLNLRTVDATLMGIFDELGLVIVPPIVYTGRQTAQLSILGEPDALAGVLERVPDDVGVEVERVSEHRQRTETLAGRVTGRQFEALETARDLGYYDVPRTASLARVADDLGCSESAASTLLRTAESALVDAALGR